MGNKSHAPEKEALPCQQHASKQPRATREASFGSHVADIAFSAA